MALKRRQFTREFKLQVLREIEAGKSVAQASREHQLHPTLSLNGKSNTRNMPSTPLPAMVNIYKDEARIAELERMIGQLTMENALLKKALLRLERLRPLTTNNGGKSSSK